MDFTNSYVVAGLIVVATVIGAQIIAWILRAVSTYVSKTKTKLDDYLIHAVAAMIRLGLIIAGVLYAIWRVWPEATIGSYPLGDLYIVFGFIWAGIAAQRVMRAIFKWYSEELGGKVRKSSQTIFSFIESLSTIGIWLIVVMLILQRFGIQIGPLLAGLGIAGVAVALGFQDTLKGIFAAFFIAVDQPIRIGDYVKLSNGTEGFVEDISWRSVRLKTFAENIVVIPNSELASMIVTNYHLPRARTGVVVPFGVAYDSDLGKVEKVSLEVAAEIMKDVAGIKDFEPVFRVYELDDSSINCKLILRAEEYTDRSMLISELIRALKERFDQEKIEIPFPQIDVHTKK